MHMMISKFKAKFFKLQKSKYLDGFLTAQKIVQNTYSDFTPCNHLKASFSKWMKTTKYL